MSKIRAFPVRVDDLHIGTEYGTVFIGRPMPRCKALLERATANPVGPRFGELCRLAECLDGNSSGARAVTGYAIGDLEDDQ